MNARLNGAMLERCVVSNFTHGVAIASTFTNCLLVANAASSEKKLFDSCSFVNCTVAGNSSAEGSSMIGCGARNAIFWDNGLLDYTGLDATNCCVEGGAFGAFNIDGDPKFVDPANGDWHLASDSPCVDAGMSSEAFGASDLLGGMRVRGGGVDIGCFEFVPTVPDTNATYGVTVPPEWLEAHYVLNRATSPDVEYQAAALAETANPRDGTAAGGRLSAWESYAWDLDPTDSNQLVRTEIELTNGVLRVSVAPESPNRAYTLLGKAALDADGWARSSDFSNTAFLETNRFFKVSVDLIRSETRHEKR